MIPTFMDAFEIFDSYGIKISDDLIEQNRIYANRKEYEDGEQLAEFILSEICDNWPQNA